MGTTNRRYSTAEFTADLFLSRVGELFEWERPATGTGEEKARMRLIEVTRYSSHRGDCREPFSLLFVMQAQRELDRDLHTLVHPSFERCALLLSRVIVPSYQRKEPDGIYYEAVFS